MGVTSGVILISSQCILKFERKYDNEDTSEGDPPMNFFYLDLSNQRHRVLSIIRAKFSDALNQVAKGFGELEKALPHYGL
jgi:hypothetical protein